MNPIDLRALPSLSLDERQQLPDCAAIYFAIARSQVLYVGKATNLKRRWCSHHRLPQLETIHKRCQVKLYWLACDIERLTKLEQQYIEYYCPTFNFAKVPKQRYVSSAKVLARALDGLKERLLGIGVCTAKGDRLKTVVLAYLAAPSEIRLITQRVRQRLQSMSRKPDSLLRWTEIVRRREGAHWRTHCHGIEVRLIPQVGECLMHHPSLREVLIRQRHGATTTMPKPEYDAIRQAAKTMTFEERLSVARRSELGKQLFPLECSAQFCAVSGIEILCLSDAQLQTFLKKHPRWQAHCPGIYAIVSDPVPQLIFS